MIKIIIAGLLISFLSLMSFTESRAGVVPDPGPGPVDDPGACCLPDGSCEDGTSISCVGVGDFQGDMSTCSTVECTQPSGVPTMGQWGMVLASVVLGFFAILRLRKLKDSELE